MDTGKFYFISNEYFDVFDPNHSLPKNKEAVGVHSANRPCFMAFPDDKDNRVFWCIPISSKVEKYKLIVEQKAQYRIKRNLPPRECDTIRFCKVLGTERAFLIQNLFPTTEKYVLSEYYDKKRHQEVRISKNSEQDIISRAQKLLRLHRNGMSYMYVDIDSIYQKLKEELRLQDSEDNVTN